ncbi:MAG: class I adenylate-forming enzyme family protein [Gemmatimonadales bacterium]|nr:class I adenylate-forming enzyme family protein [Gemmatimonadales bacterium]
MTGPNLGHQPDLFVTRVLRHAAERPDRRAVVCDGVAMSYGVLVDRAGRVAQRLHDLGFVPGGARRVGLLAANGLDVAVVVVASHLLGVAVVPVPTVITAEAQAGMLTDANVALLFFDPDHREAAHAAVGLMAAAEPVTLVPIGAEAGHPDTSALAGWSAAKPLASPAASDRAWTSDIIYSSGTTGVPKGIVQSYQVRAAACASLARLGVGADSHILQTVGLYSNFGIGALYLTLWCGGTLLIMRKFSGPAAVATLAEWPIDMTWVAPATLIRTIESPGFDAAVAGRSCTKLCAGAPLGVDHKRRVLATWPGRLLDLYGQTETGTLSILEARSAPDDKLGSVGPLIPNVLVKILDDEGRVLPPDTEGEIAGHSATMMTGYHGRADADLAAAWCDDAGRPYIRTGDIGKLDADGFLWICDRKKDMIISGGYNVFPADIERTLQGHPAVLEVAVVGFPSTRWGESPVAFVTLRDGATADEEALREWANSRVAKIQRVARVRVLAGLPAGTMGKILKRELRTRFAEAIGTLP